jgi:hypothetical protein
VRWQRRGLPDRRGMLPPAPDRSAPARSPPHRSAHRPWSGSGAVRRTCRPHRADRRGDAHRSSTSGPPGPG